MKYNNRIVQVVAVLLLMSRATADPTNSTWNYDQAGADWKDEYPACY